MIILSVQSVVAAVVVVMAAAEWHLLPYHQTTLSYQRTFCYDLAFADEIAHAVKLSGCKVMISSPESLPAAQQALQSLKDDNPVKVVL